MTASVHKIPLDDRDAWHGALEGTAHGFAHTWENCAAVARTTGFPTFLYVDASEDRKLICPIAERNHAGHLDVVTPFGFSGFAGDSPDAIAGMERWKGFALEQGYVCGYLSVNPLFSPPEFETLAEYSASNDLYLMDLDVAEDELFARLPKNRRRELRRVCESGLVPVDDERRLAAFLVEHFEEFMRGRRASVGSRMNRSTLAALCESPNTFLVGFEFDADIVAVALYGFSRHCADGIFTVLSGRAEGCMSGLVWEGMRRLRGIGIPLLNLGGGIQRGDGVARYKEQFDARKVPLGALRQVYDAPLFDDLCRDAGKTSSNYFPPYRT